MTEYNHYETLGIPRNATPAQIKQAYYKLAKQLHPDKCPNGVNIMKQVNEAYAVLSDETKRRGYDTRSPAGRSPKQPSTPPKNSGSYKKTRPKNTNSGYSSSSSGGGPSSGGPSYTYGTSSTQWGYGTDTTNKENRSKANTEEASHEWFLCIICKEIVKKDFWETFCCRKLCCADCLGIDVDPPQAKNRTICPNTLCRTPMNVRANGLIYGWTRESKVILKQLEAVAPTHVCGRNVLPKDLFAHLSVCPALNTQCFKCSGTGTSVNGVFSGYVSCNACHGQKYLPGEWTKCFSCSGTGSVLGGVFRFCTGCNGKGAIQGKWTLCYRCEGNGSVFEQVEPGSLAAPYMATAKMDGWTRGNNVILIHAITAMPTYETSSFEELRLEDYLAGNRGLRTPQKKNTTSSRQASGGKMHSPGKNLLRVGCTTCDSKGRLEGKWTVCFCCEGLGSRMNDFKIRYPCKACRGKGVMKGYNLQPCHSCLGAGCVTCSFKGSEKCNCGTSCKGHESDL